MDILSGLLRVRLDDPARRPLLIAASLVQEDLIIMRKGLTGWRLATGSLSFPSSWHLREKFGRPMPEIHAAVPGFGVGSRNMSVIQRMFDNLPPGQLYLRWNWTHLNPLTLLARQPDRRPWWNRLPRFRNPNWPIKVLLRNVTACYKGSRPWRAEGDIVADVSKGPAVQTKPRAKRRARRGGTRRIPARRLRLTRVLQGLRRTPKWLRYVLAGILVLAALLVINSLYQVFRKPSELLFPVSGTLNKRPAETWRNYGAAFRADSTANIPPELLAALAQTEAAGNPIARTYWRWTWTLHPFEIYRPASSSVGLFQMTDGTFAQAKQLCIRDHQVKHAGPWNDWGSCWFNNFYLRILPDDAIELTAAYLDLSVSDILSRHRLTAAAPQQRERLAAVVHLCGAGAADSYARHGFRFTPGQRCGDHDPRQYLAQVTRLERVFSALATGDTAGEAAGG
jgi:hypothetical protein